MCGIFGVYNFKEDHLSQAIYYGLFALQHRGQESAGIATYNGKKIVCHKAMGLVNQVFNQKKLDQLNGQIGLGHVRYSTTGSSVIENAQPIVFESKFGSIALVHNGNLINSNDLRHDLEQKGVKFSGNNDTEVISKLIINSKKQTLEAAILDAVKDCRGAFALVIMTKNSLIALRDPHGIRPLSIGRTEHSYILSSETCGLDIIGAEFVRDVANGELVVIDKDGLRSKTYQMSQRQSLCVFEFIYFARPDSQLHGRNVYEARFNMGKYLAKQNPVEADMIIPVPESGIPAAIGYSAESKIPYGEGLIKNRYVGRTFIQPSQEIRDLGVKLKLNPIRDAVRGKKIVVIDDSIMRGTTSRQIIKLLREAGAREVHMRISSPPNLNPCFYGIDTATRAELIAANLSIEGIRKYLEADSLDYLTIKNLVRAISLPSKSLCLACLNGQYPVKVPEKLQSLKLFFK